MLTAWRFCARVWELAAEEGYGLVNLDCTVVAQAPKLSPYFSAMRERLAAALDCRGDRINLKATTTEGMGFAGPGRGDLRSGRLPVGEAP